MVKEGPAVGCIAYACCSGLGLLAKRLYDHGVVHRLLQMPHAQHADRGGEWYADGDLYPLGLADRFLAGLDALLMLENVWPHSTWGIVRRARELKVRIVLCTMYEYTPHPLPVVPDAFVCPSLLDLDYYSPGGQCYVPGVPATLLPIPVEVPWRLRERALTFVHNAGHGGVNGRNCTEEVFQAVPLVKSSARIIVRGQLDRPAQRSLFARYAHLAGRHPGLTVETGTMSEDKLWSEGEVAVQPSKWDGCSAPIQEAFASGMMVMTTHRHPMSRWLPCEPLLSVHHTERMRLNSTEFTASLVAPETIAQMIDFWYGKDVSAFSMLGKEWADRHSWSVLGPRWLEVLAGNEVGGINAATGRKGERH